MFNAISRFFRELFASPKTGSAPAPDDAVAADARSRGEVSPDSSGQPDASGASGSGQKSGSYAQPGLSGTPEVATTSMALHTTDSDQVVPFDENLLERCRELWQQGDWEGLKFLDRDTLQHHPERARLALLAAAAHQQTGSIDESRTWLRLARDWGCSKQLISQIMISGVYNTLGRASAALGQMDRAQLHFEGAMRCGAPKGNVAQLTQARIATQLPTMGLTLAAPATSADGRATSADGGQTTVSPATQSNQ